MWVWNPVAREPVGEPLTGHTGPIYAIAFQPGGCLLATTGGDETGRLWNS
ncbi:hypothetical protein ACIBI9_64550 [Nonomuraea sp. NPDC050451]